VKDQRQKLSQEMFHRAMNCVRNTKILNVNEQLTADTKRSACPAWVD